MPSVNLTIQRRFPLLFLLALLVGSSPAQDAPPARIGVPHSAAFSAPGGGDTLFVLPHPFVIAGSESVFVDGRRLSADTGGYHLDARFGLLRIAPRPPGPEGATPRTVTIRYRALPFVFKDRYELRERIVRRDTLTGRTITLTRPVQNFTLDDLFGSSLQKSGSIVRGFSVGSNRDLSLTSGFRMQMSGTIANDLQLIAALTDENSPIQPEGTTQTLQEVDKVFVELRGAAVRATLGDFNATLGTTGFGRLNRKLQGAQGSLRLESDGLGGDVYLLAASARGKFTTNAFSGLDGVQGPYRLTGENGDPAVIVIAGTERVYVNGERMIRGETNDYVIDYGNAELTFSTRRLIARSSRITVDFEYTDRRYPRSILAAQSEARLGGFSLKATAIRESDNESSPVDVSLTDADRDTLRLAGDDQRKAARSGVELVGPGKGQYVADGTYHDTLGGRNLTVPIYRFDPLDSVRAVYAITFSYVGPGNGYYRKRSLSRYEFDSLRQGGYEPIRYLPMPQSHSLVDVDLSADLGASLTVSGEYAVSGFDRNTFSSRDDQLHSGSAVALGMQFSPGSLRADSSRAGRFDVRLKGRHVDERFVALDRIDEVEFNRKWNLEDSPGGNEDLAEARIAYRPATAVSLAGEAGWIRRGDPFTSQRYALSGRLFEPQLPEAAYELEVLRTANTLADLRADWTRQKGSLGHQIGSVTPRLRVAADRLANSSASSGELRTGSYRLIEIVPGFLLGREGGSSLEASIGWSRDDSADAGAFAQASSILMEHYGARWQEWSPLSTSLDLTVQHRAFTDRFRGRGNKDIETILLRSQTRFTPVERAIESDWFYEVATERTAKLERVFQRVAAGTGNYVYVGDLNGNHLADAPDFQLSRFDGEYIGLTLPTEELIPVISVKASSRVRLNPKLLLTGDRWLSKILGLFSSETYVRVEEKSSDPDTREIYLLHFSRFLRDETTLLGGNLITEDLYLQERDPTFSLRLRYVQRSGLTQFATTAERTYGRDQSMRVRWKPVEEIATQVDYLLRTDLLAASEGSSRARMVSGQSLAFDWAYRPEQQLEIGFRIGLGQATNFDTTSVDLNDQAVRLSYAFAGRGLARGEITREEVLGTRVGTALPFEVTGGKLLGRTWLWKASLDYQVTRVLQISAGYDGRSAQGGTPVHTARAEVRALF